MNSKTQARLQLLKDLNLDISPLIVAEDLYDFGATQGFYKELVRMCFKNRFTCTIKEFIHSTLKWSQLKDLQNKAYTIPKNLIFYKSSNKTSLKYHTEKLDYILIFTQSELEYLITSGALRMGD